MHNFIRTVPEAWVGLVMALGSFTPWHKLRPGGSRDCLGKRSHLAWVLPFPVPLALGAKQSLVCVCVHWHQRLLCAGIKPACWGEWRIITSALSIHTMLQMNLAVKWFLHINMKPLAPEQDGEAGGCHLGWNATPLCVRVRWQLGDLQIWLLVRLNKGVSYHSYSAVQEHKARIQDFHTSSKAYDRSLIIFNQTCDIMLISVRTTSMTASNVWQVSDDDNHNQQNLCLNLNPNLRLTTTSTASKSFPCLLSQGWWLCWRPHKP